MLHLIPKVKKLEIAQGFLGKNGVCYDDTRWDSRLRKAAQKLPFDAHGARLEILVSGDTGEAYELEVSPGTITVRAAGPAGAFYAIQTLRQLFAQGAVPCLYIQDAPDFAHRGFYHDVTRGKVPTEETLRELIDRMASYKLNSLQLYVEHTFAFEEYRQLLDTTGYLTKEALCRLDAYCKENFIDFIPSLSTFGHLYELLEQPQYRHLRVRKDFEKKENFWHSRMAHHTIDPLNPESIALIKSLIDQYIPCFTSEYFNICCDETFDLKIYDELGYDSGKLYVDFVKQIIDHVRSKGKKVMMWADILLKHPETIDQIPEDVLFLNWNYRSEPPEEKVIQLAKSGKGQIVCPGTTTWNRLCERVDVAEPNICRMAQYGFEQGALGVLNTNWGDWGNPCSLELGMYGMVLGAAKSWTVATQPDEAFYRAVDALLYEDAEGMTCLKALSDLHNQVSWLDLIRMYCYHRFGEAYGTLRVPDWDPEAVQQGCRALMERLEARPWKQEAFRQEMLLAAEGIWVIAELLAKLEGKPVTRMTNPARWLEKFSDAWLRKNQPSELARLQTVFIYCETWTQEG